MKIENRNDLNSILNKLQETQGPGRGRIGPSMMGHPCDRYLWLINKGQDVKVTPGRVMRIFRHGRYIEDMVNEDLKLAGLNIIRNVKIVIDYRGHTMPGEIDGVILSGVPGSTKRHILEVKSHNDKSFNDVVKNGVKKSKYQHYVQCQLYMYATGGYGDFIDRCYYVAVNKNDDTYYTERINYDKETALYQLDRWVHIIESTEIPRKIRDDPSWYQCKMCDMWEKCHGGNK